jgi:hypothetical protein
MVRLILGRGRFWPINLCNPLLFIEVYVRSQEESERSCTGMCVLGASFYDFDK